MAQAGHGAAPELRVETTWAGPVRCYADRVPTLIDNLARGLGGHPDRALLSAPEGAVSYREFAELVEGAVERLTAEGLRPGDRLAVCLRNGLDVAVAIWACARAGAIFVGLPIVLSWPQWSALLGHARPALVLSHPEFAADIARAAAEAGIEPDRVRALGTHLTGARVPWRADLAAPEEDTVYAVVFTSGTSARPKAVQLTHRATMHAAHAYVDALDLTAADRTAICLPFYYVSGHVTQVNPMMLAGGSALTMEQFSVTELIRVCREEGVTYLDVVPSMWRMLMRDSSFRAGQLGDLRVAVYGGARMPEDLLASVRERLPGVDLLDVYGMSETAGPITALPDTEMDAHPGTAGRPIPIMDVEIRDPDLQPVGAGTLGSIWTRGPMVTPGYLFDAEATAAALVDGWLDTGDLGSLDPDGYLRVAGRRGEVIIRGAVKIPVAEIEDALHQHPSVSVAAVLALPAADGEQQVAAAVVLVEGHRPDASALRRWVRERIARHAVPTTIRFVGELERNQTGKVDKAALLARWTTEDDA